tara:strand:+ start:323 stop:1027 length:705 start_codon:yes stop_codon:yes gene_type:complete
MAQQPPEEEQPETTRDRMRKSLRKGVDSRRSGREEKSTARKEKRSERQDTRQQRKPERQEERTAAKLAYSEARESGKGVVPATRDRRQEKMRQRLENLRGRQQPTPVAPPASQAEALEYMDPMLETRAYPQSIFGSSERRVPASMTPEQIRQNAARTREQADQYAQTEAGRKLRAQEQRYAEQIRQSAERTREQSPEGGWARLSPSHEAYGSPRHRMNRTRSGEYWDDEEQQKK